MAVGSGGCSSSAGICCEDGGCVYAVCSEMTEDVSTCLSSGEQRCCLFINNTQTAFSL